MVIKQYGSKMPFEQTDFRVGLDIGICGRAIRIYDCDVYTREYFDVSYRIQIFNHFYFRILDKLNQKLKATLRMLLQILANQFHKRKIQSF